MSDTPYLPTLCIDFDGVVHSYEFGWKDGGIYGTLTPGFMPWAITAAKSFKLVIYSSRSSTPGGIERMQEWIRAQLVEWLMPRDIDHFLALFTFASEKPAAFLTIDDRCIQFKGNWEAPELAPAQMKAFRPWTQHS